MSIFAVYRQEKYRIVLERFMLSIRGVSKSFGALRALKEVSFDIEKNRVHGIIGPNGSGKTRRSWRLILVQNEVLLKVESLSVTYGHINALKEVDMEVP